MEVELSIRGATVNSPASSVRMAGAAGNATGACMAHAPTQVQGPSCSGACESPYASCPACGPAGASAVGNPSWCGHAWAPRAAVAVAEKAKASASAVNRRINLLTKSMVFYSKRLGPRVPWYHRRGSRFRSGPERLPVRAVMPEIGWSNRGNSKVRTGADKRT
jgi:hypothetical protein